jgi:aminoglycoside phosphotransferase (APT) family kinase protein
VDGGAAGWHVLLEDLTDSHEVVTEWPIPATMEQCERIIGAHARFHAAWWDEPRLGHGVGAFIDERDFDHIMKEFSRHFAAFVDRLGDRLPAGRRRVVEQLMANASRLFVERYHSHQRLTIVHGDAHVWNALYPRDPARTDVRLIDWDGWHIDVATDDLAYMIALHCFRIGDGASSDGVSSATTRSSSRAASARMTSTPCRWTTDSRTLWQVLTPVWQAGIKLGPWIWYGHFERIMMAVDDLDCLELLA